MFIYYINDEEDIIMTEWIIPCDSEKYDIIGAFNNLLSIDWKQNNNIKKNDIIFIYLCGWED